MWPHPMRPHPLSAKLSVDVLEVVRRRLAGIAGQDPPEARPGVAERYEDQGKRPFGDRIGGALRRVDRADAPLPSRLKVDAVREPVPLQFANHLQVWREVHDVGADHRGAVGYDYAVHVAYRVHELPDSPRVLVRSELGSSLQMQPFHRGHDGKAFQVRWQEVHIAHPLSADYEHLWVGDCHRFLRKSGWRWSDYDEPASRDRGGFSAMT